MNSLGKGPEMICSYGEGSCTRAFVMREKRSAWSPKGTKRAPGPAGRPSSGAHADSSASGAETGLGGRGYVSSARVLRQRAELLHGHGEAGDTLMRCLCFRPQYMIYALIR